MLKFYSDLDYLLLSVPSVFFHHFLLNISIILYTFVPKLYIQILNQK